MKKFYYFVFILFYLSHASFAQEINKHISYVTIYDYLDELANMQVIELNSAVKPYSRKLIGEKLKEAEKKKEMLTTRQQKDLDFFLKDYNKEYYLDKNFKRRRDLFYYRDSLFMFTLNPIVGGTYSKNQSGTAWHRWWGAEVNATIGKHFGFYFSLRDNGYKNILVTPDYLTPDPGANYKPSNNRADFDDARGGLSYGWKWGSVSLVKDNFSWGNNYNGANIFSGRAPSFAYLNYKLKPAKWFEFNYIHGSLISQVIDSSHTYGAGSSLREGFIPKYIAASMATIRVHKGLNISIGNSIVYADKYIQPVYLIPFMFYPSADHTYNGAGSNALGENSQMFLDISCRSIPKTHLYGTLFIDEVNFKQMFNPAKQTNFFSIKGGIRFTNLLIKNTSFTLEYARTNPWVYDHPIPSITFASNNYNMGNYLGQNSDEIFAGVKAKPIRGLTIELDYIQDRKGPVITYQQVNGVNNNAGTPFMNEVQWKSRAVLFKMQYELINDLYVFAQCYMSEVSAANIAILNLYSPTFYQGNKITLTGGLNFGF
jgi:hypothetical protein